MYRVRRAAKPQGPPEAFVPLQMEECELSGEVGPIQPRPGPAGRPYAAARVLVRIHSRPLGVVDVPLPAGGLEGDSLRSAIEARLGGALSAHLAEDGASAATEEPACLAARRATLAHAPFASVVIPTRDRPERLRQSVSSVLACDYPRERFEVVIADNAPTDTRARELVEEVRSADERVSYVVAPRPGSGSARNDGARRARGEIVAFVDDDALVDRHWLAELVTGFGDDAEIACVAGLVMAAELDTWAQQLFEEYGGFGKGFEDAVYDTRARHPGYPLFPFNPAILGSGNNVAFRRAALLELGGYDPCLGNGTRTRSGEDWELFLRLFRAGRAAAYRPGAIVHHRHRRELGELRSQVHDYGVGIGAALARTLAHDPGAAGEIAARIPNAARYLLSSGSSKNRNQSGSYPRALRRAELAGLARGPLAYLRSRRGA
ncbi:MAG: hypothetical protein QOD53_2217 [Thermoleophilaceae bacterium]|nr:hypothetical protein [Thermoleophilaceae bacterium]